MAKLSLEIVTPRGQILETECEEVVAPGFVGEFGVLPEHTPFLVEVQPGLVWFREGNDKQYYAVSSGFAEVNKDRVLLLVESAEAATDIDAERAQSALEKFEGKLGDWVAENPIDDPKAKRYQRKIKRERARLEAATHN
jgi:F-type H+-transporting ATPase subunit epsilon